MRASILASAGLLALAALVPPARADLITFDDLAGSSYITSAYHGLTWSNFYVVDGVHYVDPSGYQNSVVSANNVALNAGGNQALLSDGRFDFNSAYMTAAWYDGLSVTVTGYLGGTQEYQKTVVVDTTGASFNTFNFLGVDKVTFDSFGGTLHPGYRGASVQFALDNMTINDLSASQDPAVPLPAAVWSALALLGGIGLRRTMRRR